jgi:uncharacterized protein with NRDE domain
MCTVTVVPHPRGVRLVSNRDELRSRAMAEPPAWRRAGPLAALWPRDPESGGTWVGVNAAGIAMTILNRNPRDRRGASGALRSRGTIIPRLLRCDRLDAVLDEASRLAAFEFEPFTLVVVERGALAVVENHRGGICRSPPGASFVPFSSPRPRSAITWWRGRAAISSGVSSSGRRRPCAVRQRFTGTAGRVGPRSACG